MDLWLWDCTRGRIPEVGALRAFRDDCILCTKPKQERITSESILRLQIDSQGKNMCMPSETEHSRSVIGDMIIVVYHQSSFEHTFGLHENFNSTFYFYAVV